METLQQASLNDVLQELDGRGLQFVWVSFPREGHPDECRLCRSNSITDKQALWLLDRASACVGEELESNE